MKYISLIAAILLFNNLTYCQDLFGNGDKTREAIIASIDSTVYLSVLTENPKRFKTELNINYTWYSNKQIHSNIGEYSGKLLHGHYEVYNTSGALMTKGIYQNGTKTGSWKYYRISGRLKMVEEWDEGEIISRNAYNSKGQVVFSKVFDIQGKNKEAKEKEENKKKNNRAEKESRKKAKEKVKKKKVDKQKHSEKKRISLKLFKKNSKDKKESDKSRKEAIDKSQKKTPGFLKRIQGIFSGLKKDKADK